MHRFRELIALAALLGGMLATVGSASAGAPIADAGDETFVFCNFEVEIGRIEFVFGADNTDPGDDDWEPPFFDLVIRDDEGEESIVGGGDPEVLYSFDPAAFGVDTELIAAATQAPVGSTSVVGTFAPAGEPESFEERYNDGNVRVVEQGSVTPLALSGVFETTVGDMTWSFDLADCEGERAIWESWETNPTVYVRKLSGTDLWCDVEQDGWMLELFGGSDEGGGELFLDAYAPDGALAWFGYSEQFAPSVRGVSTAIDLWAPMDEDPSATGLLEADFTLGDVFTIDVVWQELRYKDYGYEVAVEGTLALPEIEFDLAACEGEYHEVRIFERPDLSQGKGPVPANDLPDGAMSLTFKRNDHNRMAAEEPEAACIVAYPWGGADIPLGRTLWYTVQGTGASLTVDTAGSDFDTVMGIYVDEGGELAHVACVDDVFDESGITTLAAITLDTVAGETYYVQVGGFFGEYGLVKLELK